MTIISTKIGEFDTEKFDALINVREAALEGLREAVKQRKYSEVTVSSLVNIAGSCENPYASFTLNYYGREAHLSQSAQLQLEILVLRLRRGFFTISNSFREEDYTDPEAPGRRLSEFTLVESEMPYESTTPEKALDAVVDEETEVIKDATQKIVDQHLGDITKLGGDVDYLRRVVASPFERITYDEALHLLKKLDVKKGEKGIVRDYKFGDDLDTAAEKVILKSFGNIPTFVTHYPADIKFFNMKKTSDGQSVYSFDLLAPVLGEMAGGGVREESIEAIRQQLMNSRITEFLRDKARKGAKELRQDPELAARLVDPMVHFSDYISTLGQTQPILTGGYGVGFERFVGFLLQTNDILETVAYRTVRP